MEHSAQTAHIVGNVVVLLLLAAAILAITKRIRLPFSVALLLCGIGLSQLADHFPDTLAIVHQFTISPALILFVFLPTLIFESTYNMDSSLLRHNLGEVMVLAVPGLLLSTLLIGGILALATPLPLAPALLLGAILSATDPVAVVALFKQLGASQRLTVLVEGESLFNDATSIVVAKILVGVVLAGAVSAQTLLAGAADFFILFAGGLLVGWLLGLATGYVLGLVESDPYIEISLTTVAAYLSFLIAEDIFHVSGVMATVATGLILGGWGRMKISPSVRTYLEHFWEYMAFIANAMIFLLVGLELDLAALAENLDLLIWVVVAMLVARAALIYGLMPLVGRLPGSVPISLSFQTVMYWGGLRGAIALAIVLSLPAFEYRELFEPLVMGAVLFTLLVQGLTMEPLVRWLGLSTPPLSDRLAVLERDINARQQVQERIPALLSSGIFSRNIARRLERQCEREIAIADEAIKALRTGELSQAQQVCLLYLRTFAEERLVYVTMYNNGHLTEAAFRELSLVLSLQTDAIRYHGRFEHVHSHRMRRYAEHRLYPIFDQMWGLNRVVEWLRLWRVARDYEEVWGHYRSGRHVLAFLDEYAATEPLPEAVLDEVRNNYRRWYEIAERRLHLMAQQYPEFVRNAQERVARRMVLQAEQEATLVQEERGAIPHSLAEQMTLAIAHRLRALRGLDTGKLIIEPAELLRKVRFLRQLDQTESMELVKRMRAHTFEENADIITQGNDGDSLFLIARGVVRISREDDEGHRTNLGTLMAGDFFGETALLTGEPRNASVTAMTPCSVYELKRADIEDAMAEFPAIKRALEEAAAQR